MELWSYFIDILAFEQGKLCPGVGILFRFLDPGAGVLHWKAVPEAGIMMKKINGPGVSPGGMVTGQVDTCITLANISGSILLDKIYLHFYDSLKCFTEYKMVPPLSALPITGTLVFI